MKLGNTPVTHHQFHGLEFYLKRDDLLHPQFSGNKARKLLSLIEQPPKGINALVGYGSPQANSLYSLAALAKLKGWRLDFYVDHIADFLKANPLGNYAKAKQLGANIIEVPQSWRSDGKNTETALKEHLNLTDNQLFVEEGGRMAIAEYGVKTLAREIVQWVGELENTHAGDDTAQPRSIVVVLPSGTGTTSLYLNKHLQDHGIDVLTSACVGGEDYLRAQFHQLSPTQCQPLIWSLSKKHHFGKLYKEDFTVWQELLEQTGVEFELLYDPLMWRVLLEHREQLVGKTLLYIHQGGVVGNESMLPRYRRKYAMD